MMDPELFMLDEPSLELAPIVVEELFERIIQIRETGKTILLIEQNVSWPCPSRIGAISLKPETSKWREEAKIY
jgi:ABC-type branched-subunit amino acid transport system ATPase component